MVYRRFCQTAAIVFALFTVYPVVAKSLDGRLAHDWAHSALHFISMIVAAAAGWFTRSTALAQAYAWGIGIGYSLLGVVGWFIDGLLLSTRFAVPLGPVENIFHLALGLSALAVVLGAAAARRPRPGR